MQPKETDEQLRARCEKIALWELAQEIACEHDPERKKIMVEVSRKRDDIYDFEMKRYEEHLSDEEFYRRSMEFYAKRNARLKKEESHC